MRNRQLVHFFDRWRSRSHPLHAMRKTRFFRRIVKSFDPVVRSSSSVLPRPIYLRLFSNASLILDLSGQESMLRELFLAVLGAFPADATAAFWDIGANVGLFSWYCASAAPEFEIVSFEPDGKNLECLRRTSALWHLPAHEIVPAAVAEREGRAQFFADEISGATGTLGDPDASFNAVHYGARPRGTEIDVVTLDGALARASRPPAVVKIDVEGAEVRVLQGAGNLLEKHRPILFFETFEHRDEILAILTSLNYVVFDSERHARLVPETLNFIALCLERTPAPVISALCALGCPLFETIDADAR